MSKNSLNKLIELDALIQKHGQKGVRLLHLFKLLKIKVIEMIEKEYPTILIDEETLNKICIQNAQRIIKRGKENLTEDDIKEIILKIMK